MNTPTVSYIEPRMLRRKTDPVHCGFVNFTDGNRLTFDHVKGVQKEAGGYPVKEEYVRAAEEAVAKAVADGEFVMAPAESRD